ncbi:MAG: hypothetical protein GWN64_02675, partial [Candidatus Thorarchaeota archaeon]|nr:hypothetical protein [Candidatus Thorarchaeota archaeon]
KSETAKKKSQRAINDEEKAKALQDKGGHIALEIMFTEDVLGTTPGDKELLKDYVVQQMLEEQPRSEEEQKEEMEATTRVDHDENLDDEMRKNTTFFPRIPEDGTPFLWNYQTKGTLKEAGKAMRIATSDKFLSNYKKLVDLLIFPYPRRVPLILPEGITETTFLERPVRAPTPQGERVFILRSEVIPAGTTARFGISFLSTKLEKYIRKWLDYGRLHGYLQWRNGGYGTYAWRELSEGEEVTN